MVQTLRDATAMQVALHVPLNAGAVPKLDPEAHATYVPATGALVFVADHLDPLQPRKTYELWLLPAHGWTGSDPCGTVQAGCEWKCVRGDADTAQGCYGQGIWCDGGE